MIIDNYLKKIFDDSDNKKTNEIFSNVPYGSEPLIISALKDNYSRNIIYIAENKKKYNQIKDFVNYLDIKNCCFFPEYDTNIYDRISPNKGIVSERIRTLINLNNSNKSSVLITTANASLQYVIDKNENSFKKLMLKKGENFKSEELIKFFIDSGYTKSTNVREVGDFAVRGGIIDFFSYGNNNPIRLDFIGNTIETIKEFDISTQTSIKETSKVYIYPCQEIVLDENNIKIFRKKFNQKFGSKNKESKLYESVSNNISIPGIESWLTLFCEKKSDLFSYLNNPIILIENNSFNNIFNFYENVYSQYQSRLDFDASDNQKDKYFSLNPEELFLNLDEYNNIINKYDLVKISPLNEPESINLNGNSITKFFSSNNLNKIEYEKLRNQIKTHIDNSKLITIACSSEGSKLRLKKILHNQGIESSSFDNWNEYKDSLNGGLNLNVLNLTKGFEIDNYVFISEQDIFGERFYRSRNLTSKNFIKDINNINPGDLIIHIDHGLGKFEKLSTIKIENSDHECLLLNYKNNDRLYLPVENLEMISKYNSQDENIELDRLGGKSWKIKTKKIKEDILILAQDLIDIAAKRKISNAKKYNIQDDYYDNFCAKFSHEETEDQLNSINNVLDDLQMGIPMDRLICGDVGFGKTEVALRASFLVSLEGKQVAILAPTTLLARQHYETFKKRFSGLPVNIVELSRLSKNKKNTIESINNGSSDIIIGTHALLSDKVEFRNLGLLIIDEEQHFGVKHKEKLKKLKSDIHVLTLTATPIPRTMQLAMTGVKDLSIIATPPIDRRSIETYIFKEDKISIKEALIRERNRGGQSFYVVPRISDIKKIEDFIKDKLPNLSYVIAHGQMSSSILEDRMHDFYNGEYDILISTSIIESGLDLPNANTIIIHKANLFGLSQLYQIRGRVGRSDKKAYALITYENEYHLGKDAVKRLEAMQSLDSLGAGFNLASHDLDIRGSGNILGEQQSGHIKQIGIELYQEMLEQTIANIKNKELKVIDNKWSPKISIDLPILIPEDYIEDINLRMEIYRRLSIITDISELELLEVEIIDRFGHYPKQVKILLRIISIKIRCKDLNIESIKNYKHGFIIQLRDNIFSNPEGLLSYITTNQDVEFKPDEKIVFKNTKDEELLDFIDIKIDDLETIKRVN